MSYPQPQVPQRGRTYPFWRWPVLLLLVAFPLKSMVATYYGHRAFQEGHAQHLAAAIQDCRTSLRLNSGSAAVHNNLGYYLYESGDYSQALTECQRAIQINPNNASAHDSLAQVLSHTGRSDEAIQECQEAIRLKPNKAVFYNSLGYALYQKGQKAEARQQWQRAATMGDPDAASDAHHLLTQYPE